MNFRTNITKLSNKLALNYRKILRNKLMTDDKDLQRDTKILKDGHPSNEPKEPETDVANAADKSVRKVNSQVFSTDEDTAVNENIPNNTNSNTRRKSSWAFWNSTDVPNDDNTINDPSALKTATDEIEDANEIPKDQPKSDSDKIKTVVIDGEERIFENRDRSYSWSFWSSKLTHNATSTGSSKPNIILNKSVDKTASPDVIKSEVSRSEDKNLNIGSTPGPTPGPNPNKSIQKKNSKLNLVNNRPNIIVPRIEDTLPFFGTHTMFYNGYKKVRAMLGYDNDKELHLYRKLEPTMFKRVLIIGVHGFFPTRMIRPIIGEPTGTSMKFAQVAENSILQWAKENNMNIEIQKIALEKEGKIFDRVDFFFDILKNSASDIKKADFIFICAHSQGTPVSVILISKLLEYGIIDEDKKIGILGMAGINNGPFSGMDQSFFIRAYSAIENESLLELFQFQNFESLQSRKYLESIRNLVRHNVKITYVGSIDDQLVPLYSSIASHVQHPNLFKAVYIDGSTHTPDFVSRIIKLSCYLQNIGFSDHDVIKEISYALAGPITGGGHSRIYNDSNVYKLALDFTLKTESSSLAIEQPVKFKPFDIKKLGAGSNPYNLPWCARGLFFEVIKRVPEGKEEVELVFKEFENWNPESKVLKDVKYRLNGIRAKL